MILCRIHLPVTAPPEAIPQVVDIPEVYRLTAELQIVFTARMDMWIVWHVTERVLIHVRCVKELVPSVITGIPQTAVARTVYSTVPIRTVTAVKRSATSAAAEGISKIIVVNREDIHHGSWNFNTIGSYYCNISNRC